MTISGDRSVFATLPTMAAAATQYLQTLSQVCQMLRACIEARSCLGLGIDEQRSLASCVLDALTRWTSVSLKVGQAWSRQPRRLVADYSAVIRAGLRRRGRAVCTWRPGSCLPRGCLFGNQSRHSGRRAPRGSLAAASCRSLVCLLFTSFTGVQFNRPCTSFFYSQGSRALSLSFLRGPPHDLKLRGSSSNAVRLGARSCPTLLATE